jgi:hypothetical protein
LGDENVRSRISGPSTELLYDVIADSRISGIYTETLFVEKQGFHFFGNSTELFVWDPEQRGAQFVERANHFCEMINKTGF